MAKFVAGKELLWTPIWITKNHQESISLYFLEAPEIAQYSSSSLIVYYLLLRHLFSRFHRLVFPEEDGGGNMKTRERKERRKLNF